MRRLAAPALALGVLSLLLTAAPAAASFEQVAAFADSGEAQQLHLGGDAMAVNTSGVGGVPAGTVYAAGTNSVAVYGPKGEFRETWGWGVAENGKEFLDKEFQRCGPDGEAAHPVCRAGSRSGGLGNSGEEGPGQPREVRGIAVDQSTGYVYVSTGREKGVVLVFSADGSQLIGEFGERGAFKETLAEGPEKVHGIWPGGIAVDGAGTVYLSDRTLEWETRVMVFKPQTPGDYEHYVYAGLASDIATSHGTTNYFPEHLGLDEAGNLYAGYETAIYEFAPGKPASPSCKFIEPKSGITGMTVDFPTGEVFYASSKDLHVHVLKTCSFAVGKFERGEEFSADPNTSYLTGMAFNPTLAYEPGRAAGTLYAADMEQSVGRGLIFAPASGAAKFKLTVAKTGTGSGTVTSVPAGISCDPTCSAEFEEGKEVELKATADAGSEFTEWTGACTGTGACKVTMTEAKAVGAVFAAKPIPEFTLTVTVSGEGKVSADSGTISGCTAAGGSPCKGSYPEGAKVTLTETPGVGQQFGGWGTPQCDESTATTCLVEVKGDEGVVASFVPKVTPKFKLKVNVQGAGQVSGEGIGCPGDCEEEFEEGKKVTLSQAASPGSKFTGWSGACTGAGACEVTMSGAREVSARFDPVPKFKLTVSKSGAGQGTLTSTPAGISCNAACSGQSAEFEEGKEVELKETPEAGSEFVKWSGACTGTGACKVTMTEAKAVGAEFKLLPKPKFKLTVSKSGTGAGTVTSTPAGISCAPACATASAEFEEGAKVALKAEAAAGSEFVKWSGACSGSGSCEVTMSAAKEATAEFKLLPKPKFKLSVTRSGSGTVTSAPAGIDCGTTCAAEFEAGTAVTLSAVPLAGQGASWSGCDSVNAQDKCLVTMSAARSVTASFEALVPLEVLEPGSGEGTVTSSPAGIECGPTCSAGFVKGQLVTLTASPAPHTKAVKWSGCDSVDKEGRCLVTMSGARTAIATFELERQWTEYMVTVQRKGTGQGTVTSAPAGIQCGEDCSEPYLYDTQLTLTATPAPGSAFKEWSGGGCLGQTGPCTTAVTGPRLIRAIFVAVGVRTLSVAKAGTGQGTVSSKAAGIDCGQICSVELDASTWVTLRATAAPDSSFSGWSGEGCTGTATCRVLMNEARNLTATFAKLPAPPPPPQAHCIVPRLIGKTLAKARAALATANCALGKVRRPRGAKLAALRVRSSSPAAGTTLPAGGAVSLRLGRRR